MTPRSPSSRPSLPFALLQQDTLPGALDRCVRLRSLEAFAHSSAEKAVMPVVLPRPEAAVFAVSIVACSVRLLDQTWGLLVRTLGL